MAISIIICLSGCKNNDEKARELHNKAITASREGRTDEAILILEKIVLNYPGTQTAIEANQTLAARDAISAMSKETVKEAIDMALQLYRLDNGKYPSTEQGVRALVAQPRTGDVPRRWRDGGYIEDESMLNIVSGYESNGEKYKLSVR